jgi:mannose-6-phosphate isomerase-like protein (cupin superfamily)
MEYTLVDLEQEWRDGRKWFFGPFLPPSSGNYTTALEIGYINLKKVIDTDRLHFHSEAEEYYVVLGGRMLIQVGNQNIEVSAGQVLLVRPGVPHLMLEVEPDTSILLVKAPARPGDKQIVGTV